MKQGLLLALLLPLPARADGGLAAAGLAEAFVVFCVVGLVFFALVAALAVASLRRPTARGLLKRHGQLLAALTLACVVAAYLDFFLGPFLGLVVMTMLSLVVTLARQASRDRNG